MPLHERPQQICRTQCENMVSAPNDGPFEPGRITATGVRSECWLFIYNVRIALKLFAQMLD